jgi:hypothetical protein
MTLSIHTTARVVHTPHITESGERPKNKLERNIEDSLLRYGYGRVEGNGNQIDPALAIYLHGNPGLFKRGFHYGLTLAGRPKITDFVISTKGMPILVEAKEQDTRGTAYEKIPYSIQCLQATGMPWMLVYDGDYIPEAMMDDQRRRTKLDENCQGIFKYDFFEGFLRSIA